MLPGGLHKLGSCLGERMRRGKGVAGRKGQRRNTSLDQTDLLNHSVQGLPHAEDSTSRLL